MSIILFSTYVCTSMYEYLHIYISSLYRGLYLSYLEQYSKITAILPKFIVSPGQRSRDDRCQHLCKLLFQLMCPKRDTLGVDGKKKRKKKSKRSFHCTLFMPI